VAVPAYIAAIAVAEAVGAGIGVVPSILGHAVLISILLSQYVLTQVPYRRVLPVLAIVSLLRILSFTAPIAQVPDIYWYVLVGLPLLVAVALTVSLLDFSWAQLGLRRGPWMPQLLVASSGLPLSLAGFLLLRPRPFASMPGWREVAIGVVILLIFVGFTEEILFRGLLQHVATEVFGRTGVLCSSLLFAIMYIGSRSASYLLFIALLGLFFGWCASRTGSIWGVVLAHSFIAIGMTFVWPFVDAGLNQGMIAQISAALQWGLWLLVVIGVGLLLLRYLQHSGRAQARRVVLAPILVARDHYRPADSLNRSNQLEYHRQERDTMDNEPPPQSKLDSVEARQHGMPSEIEQLIERIGARYIDDLRTLSEQFGRFYDAQLTAKDEQIADLSQRLEVAERQRDTLEAQHQELKRTSASYVANLRTMSEELSRHLEYTEDEHDASKAPNQGGSP